MTSDGKYIYAVHNNLVGSHAIEYDDGRNPDQEFIGRVYFQIFKIDNLGRLQAIGTINDNVVCPIGNHAAMDPTEGSENRDLSGAWRVSLDGDHCIVATNRLRDFGYPRHNDYHNWDPSVLQFPNHGGANLFSKGYIHLIDISDPNYPTQLSKVGSDDTDYEYEHHLDMAVHKNYIFTVTINIKGMAGGGGSPATGIGTAPTSGVTSQDGTAPIYNPILPCIGPPDAGSPGLEITATGYEVHINRYIRDCGDPTINGGIPSIKQQSRRQIGGYSNTIDKNNYRNCDVINQFGSIDVDGNYIYAVHKNVLVIADHLDYTGCAAPSNYPVGTMPYLSMIVFNNITPDLTLALDTKIVGDSLYILWGEANSVTEQFSNNTKSYITKYDVKSRTAPELIYTKQLVPDQTIVPGGYYSGPSRLLVIGNNIYTHAPSQLTGLGQGGPSWSLDQGGLITIEVDGIETDHAIISNIKSNNILTSRDIQVGNSLVVDNSANIGNSLKVGCSINAASGNIGDLNLSGDLNSSGDINMCNDGISGTIICSSFAGCSPINFNSDIIVNNDVTFINGIKNKVELSSNAIALSPAVTIGNDEHFEFDVSTNNNTVLAFKMNHPNGPSLWTEIWGKNNTDSSYVHQLADFNGVGGPTSRPWYFNFDNLETQDAYQWEWGRIGANGNGMRLYGPESQKDSGEIFEHATFESKGGGLYIPRNFRVGKNSMFGDAIRVYGGETYTHSTNTAWISLSSAAQVYDHGLGSRTRTIYGQYDIQSGGGIITSGSDIRIKDIIGISSSFEDLENLLKLEVTNYTYKDNIRNPGEHKKLIAQNVLTAVPNAVSLGDNFIPNIYQPSESITINENECVIKISDIKDSAIGDIIQINYNNARQVEVELTAIDSSLNTISFTLGSIKEENSDLTESNTVFVYGKKVSDYHYLDYDHVMCLNISATQELHKIIQEKETKIQDLETRLAAIEANLGI